MVRGINKSTIFEDQKDRTRFPEWLGQNVSEEKCSFYAWVLTHIIQMWRKAPVTTLPNDYMNL